ncbi:hypothetical protein BV22DRAFT_1025439 [Leucogyrophana mollusca]|uniref:Uncharacterized protein n=1 Tax=Leucogyrophana mollusca TaxID=85980 RepID=A0ACB8AY46_9AGAM|nr:hypothetical protein BV22DRAFT_1025439 [Leucogyrophana mollusca]
MSLVAAAVGLITIRLPFLLIIPSQVERVLQLLADANIKLSDIDLSGKKPAKTPLKHNKATGKESGSGLAFSEANWGAATRSYMKAIERRGDEVIIVACNLAHNLVTRRCGGQSRASATTVDEDESEDERALV